MTHETPQRSSGIDLKKAILVVLFLGIAAYQWYSAQNQPVAEGNQPGVNENVVDVPDTIDLNLPEAAGDSADTKKDKPRVTPKPYLADGGNGSKVSPGGLVYTSTRHGEHRTAHVLRHASDQPKRAGSHGVFDVDDEDQLFQLIDEAYALIKSQSKRVDAGKEEDGKRAFVVDMKRVIGYRGGQNGKRDGYPKLKKIKLILADNRVITAYPY